MLPDNLQRIKDIMNTKRAAVLERSESVSIIFQTLLDLHTQSLVILKKDWDLSDDDIILLDNITNEIEKNLDFIR